MKKNSMTLPELHAVFLNMMKEFHSYCVEHGLTYYMVGGTLLGAVREHGFIAWDDDVDFAMPRPDYERFIKECKIFRIEYLGNNKKCTFPYAKVFNLDKPIVTIDDAQYSTRCMLFLRFDLYPIDGVGNDVVTARKHADWVQRLRKFCFLNQSDDKSSNPIKRIIVGLLRVIPTYTLMKLQDKAMQKYSYENSCLVTRWRMPSLSNNIVAKDTFEPAKLLPFEDTALYAPAKYDSYLRQVYGDYMKPVRENSGMRHDCQTNSIVSSFKEYLEDTIEEL